MSKRYLTNWQIFLTLFIPLFLILGLKCSNNLYQTFHWYHLILCTSTHIVDTLNNFKKKPDAFNLFFDKMTPYLIFFLPSCVFILIYLSDPYCAQHLISIEYWYFFIYLDAFTPGTNCWSEAFVIYTHRKSMWKKPNRLHKNEWVPLWVTGQVSSI